MAKVSGPLFSMDAAGKLGNDLIIQTWRGRCYVRKLTKPANNPSPKQRGLRLIWAALNRYWPTMSMVHQAAWAAQPGPSDLSGLNKWLAHSIVRSETVHYPVPGNAYNQYSPLLYPTAGPGGQHFTDIPTEGTVQFRERDHIIDLRELEPDWADAWLWAIYRIPAEDNALIWSSDMWWLENLVGVQLRTELYWEDTQVDTSQSWNYTIASFMPHGVQAVSVSEF